MRKKIRLSVRCPSVTFVHLILRRLELLAIFLRHCVP